MQEPGCPRRSAPAPYRNLTKPAGSGYRRAQSGPSDSKGIRGQTPPSTSEVAGDPLRPWRELIPSPRENDKIIKGNPAPDQGFEGVFHNVARIPNNRLGMNPNQGMLPADVQNVMNTNLLRLAHQYDPGEEIVPKPPITAGEAQE
jgi:hypothetical protein